MNDPNGPFYDSITQTYHLFTQFKDNSKFPIADTEWLKMISIPVHLHMTDEDIDYVIYWINKFFYN